MARVVVALCLANAAMVGDALGYGVPKKDPLEVPSEAYDVDADPDNTALVPITALGIPAVPGVPTVSGLAGPPNPADVKGLAAGGPNPLNAVLNAVINAGADSTLGTPTGIKFKDVASGDPYMTAASMESCRFVTRRSPGCRFWSVVDVRKRLHRTHGGFHRCIHMSKVLCALLLWTMICQRFRSRALWGAPSTGARCLGDHPTPDLSRSESEGRSASEKSK